MQRQPTTRSSYRLLAAALLAGSAAAHVDLDEPNGGEQLDAGSVFRIEWTVAQAHNLVDWDLWYSTNGLQGPWIPIAMDLPPGNPAAGSQHHYDWTVPNTPSTSVRVRVRQDNTGTDYTDESDADLEIRLACAPPAVYCAAKTNSLGCDPAISATGCASASSAGPFDVVVDSVRNQKSGLFFYTVGGSQAATPFQGGTLCVGPAGIRRTPVQSAGGNPSPADDCSGTYALDFNAFAAGAAGGNPDPGLAVPGSTYQVQAWGRDQGFPAPNNTTLSDALDVTVGP